MNSKRLLRRTSQKSVEKKLVPNIKKITMFECGDSEGLKTKQKRKSKYETPKHNTTLNVEKRLENAKEINGNLVDITHFNTSGCKMVIIVFTDSITVSNCIFAFLYITGN